MRQYLFQSVVDLVALVLSLVLIAVIAAITASSIAGSAVLGAIQADARLLPVLLIFSIVLTAVHWFVRPLLVIFFGNWLIRSFGLFALILDIALFYLAILIAPVQFEATAGPWWAVPVVAVIYNAFDFLIAALVGVERPQLQHRRAHDAFWKQLERLPSMRRNWISEKLRLEEAVRTFLTYGVEIGLADTPIGPVRQWFTRFVYGQPNPMDQLSTPAKIRVMLEQLGPTYIKFGQMASSQSQTLPPEWVAELARLQSAVPPVPYAQAKEVIVSEFGKPPEELFATFEQEALAAASTAQVHRATLLDGTAVAVKVQRPNIVASVKADLGLLQDVSRLLENISSYARDLDVTGILSEFGDGVIRELDYRNEAYHAARLADSMQGLPLIHVPVVYTELSASRVLTMEFIHGVNLEKPGALDRPGIDRSLLAEAFTRALIKQLFIDGFFHGDPHPGNIVLDVDTGELTFLDLGLVGRLDQTSRMELIDLLVSFQQVDAASLASVALRVSNKTRHVNVHAFREDMAEMLNQYVHYASQPQFGATVSHFMSVLQRYGLRLDRQFMLAIKAVGQSEAVVAALGGSVDFVEFAIKEIKSQALAQVTREKVLETLTQQATQVGKEMLRRVPNLQDATVSWLDQYLAGKLVVHVDAHELTQQVEALGTSFSRVAAGLVMTGMILATAIVSSQLWSTFGDKGIVSYLAVGVFVVLLVAGGRLAWSLLHPPRRPYVE